MAHQANHLQVLPQPAHVPPGGGAAEPLVFQFPSTEEMSQARGVAPIPAQIAIPDGAIPHHIHPSLLAGAGGVIVEPRHPEEVHQQHISIPVPSNFVEALSLQQQQQQLQLLAQQQQPTLMINQEQFAELQRQYLLAYQEVQKNPSAINHPNIQAVISHYQQVEPYIQHAVQQQQFQEMLMQQELMKQQHQQKFASQSTARPGVIINLQGK